MPTIKRAYYYIDKNLFRKIAISVLFYFLIFQVTLDIFSPFKIPFIHPYVSTMETRALGESWVDGYLYRKEITVNSGEVSGSGNLANFSLLINLTDSDLRTTANGGKVEDNNGYDIIFADSAGNIQLDHEVERYEASAGELIAYVRIPILSCDTDTTIYLYYGNGSVVASQENIPAVWDANYKLVHHLDETSGVHNDSTNNNNDGTVNNGVDQDVAGQINGADGFDGVNDYISVFNSLSLSIADEITVEGWMNAGESWRYKKVIALSPVTPEADYQVEIELTPANFDHSKAMVNGEDLRFYQADGTKLDYWIENWNAAGTSLIWVEVADSGTGEIYLHYGNPEASAESSGANTFLFFDDFEDGNDNGWMEHNGDWYVADNAYYQNANLGTYMRTSSGESGWEDYVFETKMKIASGGGTGGFAGVLFRFQDINNHYAMIFDDRPDDSFWIRRWAGGSYTALLEDNSITIDRDVWYDLKISVADEGTGNATIKVWIDGDYKNERVDAPQNFDSGRIGLMMHGTQSYFDDIRVRKYVSSEPSVTVGDETGSGISKNESYGIDADASNAYAFINDQSVTSAISPGWNHLAFTYDRNAGGTDEMKLYVNGGQAATGDYANPIQTNLNDLFIGDLLSGSLDEIRVSDIARSSDWIQTGYNNQNNPSAFYTLGTEEEPNDSPNYPLAVSPENGSSISNNYLILSANYSDPDAGDVGTTNYRISSSSLTDCVGGTGLVAAGTSTETVTNNENTNWTSPTLENGTYYWCAQNDDGAKTSDWMPMGSFTLKKEGGSGGGSGLPPGAYSPPFSPIPVPENPSGNFQIIINNNDESTNQRTVTLTFSSGADTQRMSISNTSDFKNASQEQYQSEKVWMLEEGDGTKTVFVRFYTKYGVASETVQDSIILKTKEDSGTEPVSKEPVLEPTVPDSAKPALPEESTFTETLKFGSGGEQVVKLQDILKELGYFPKRVPSTGYFGPITKRSLIKFQNDAYSIGIVNSGTWEILNSNYERR